jgi:hypothetical protein
VAVPQQVLKISILKIVETPKKFLSCFLIFLNTKFKTMKKLIVSICLLAVCFLGIFTSQAQDSQEGMSEEFMEKMAQWMKYAEPGEHHEHLAPFVGSWKLTGKHRMSSDAPWMEFNSTAKAETIMGGRFISMTIKGEVTEQMPMPFEAMQMFGYDNYAQQYVSTWVDNYGTMMMVLKGYCEDDGKTMVLNSSYNDVTTGTIKSVTYNWRVMSNDRILFYETMEDDDGNMYEAIKIEYNRVKE